LTFSHSPLNDIFIDDAAFITLYAIIAVFASAVILPLSSLSFSPPADTLPLIRRCRLIDFHFSLRCRHAIFFAAITIIILRFHYAIISFTLSID
jgi:hypothetical protein